MVFEDTSELEAAVEANDLAKLEAMIGGGQGVRAPIGFARSAMMLSANNIRHLNKLDTLACDIVILNLEDGVAPSQKKAALRLAAIFLSHLKSAKSRCVVRVNPLNEGGLEEIAFLNPLGPDAFRIPKVTGTRDVERALEAADPGSRLHLSIETKEAYANMATLKIDTRIEAFYLGILDLLASLHLPQTLVVRDNPLMHHLLAEFLIQAQTLQVLPVSFVYQRYKDLAEFEAWCALEKMMGYHCKGCISPAQVEIANRVFSPDAAMIARAEKIVALFEANRDFSTGIVDEILGFVDEPIYKDAKNIMVQFG